MASDNMLKPTAEYFRAHQDYFWQWADKGAVIEWRDGQTICYREDLLPILEKLSPDGLPPLGAILLIMAACRDEWKAVSAGRMILLFKLIELVEYHDKGNRPDMLLRESTRCAGLLLDTIAALPAEYRTGAKRTDLLYTLFRDEMAKADVRSSRQYIEIFNRGVLDSIIFKPGVFPPGKTFEREMESLSRVQKLFPEAQLLEMKVRTGLEDIPSPAELSLLQQGAGNFLEQLEEDDRLAGLVQLTRKLIAALNIPLHTHGSSDRELGGISDIANRGSFDRLLISELANDDETLMARLANNEALFLRREELPSDPDRERVLLIDTTLKMWGTPRVFAMAAALACICNARPGMKTMAYVLGSTGWLEAELGTKEGIIRALEKVDSALDCRVALQTFLNSDLSSAHPEIFLITEDGCLHDMHFQTVLGNGKAAMTACISVERSGQMRFYELSKGHRKLTSEALFDMSILVHRPVTVRTPKTGSGPASLQQAVFPLRHPATRMKFRHEFCFMPVRRKLFCVTLDRRVLYWEDKALGGRELIAVVQEGHRHWGFDGKDTAYLLVNVPGSIWLYRMDTSANTASCEQMSFEGGVIVRVMFEKGHYFIQTNTGLYMLDARTGALDVNREAKMDISWSSTRPLFELQTVKELVNNGYSVLVKIQAIYINRRGDLCLDTRHIKSFRNEQRLAIVTTAGQGRETAHYFKRTDTPVWIPGAAFHFQRFVSKDGSEAVVDSRGFLHLRSSDPGVPEMTVVLILERPTAVWASDGKACGAPYFGVPPEEDIERFYHLYIQRFIDVIQKSATVH